MCALLPARFCRIPLATDKFILHSRRRRDRQPFSIVDQPLAFSRSSFSLPPPPSASRLSVSFCCLLPLTPRFSSLFLISFFSTSTSLRSKNRRSRAYSMAIDRDAHRSSNPAALRETFSFKQTFTHSLAISIFLFRSFPPRFHVSILPLNGIPPRERCATPASLRPRLRVSRESSSSSKSADRTDEILSSRRFLSSSSSSLCGRLITVETIVATRVRDRNDRVLQSD